MLSSLLPLEPPELAFLNALNDRGEILPALLTDDTQLQNRIQAHPGLQWKAINVKKHFGGD